MSKSKILTKLVCSIMVVALSCILLTGCGHKLSGTYKNSLGLSVSFTSKEDCRMYYDSTDTFLEGIYYWDKELKCYFLEFNETGQGNVRFRAELQEDKLYVTMQGEKLIFDKA